MFLVSLPCTSCSPPLFCVYLVLAWQGTHDAGHTCWNIFYVHCFKPLSRRNRNKKEGASNLSGFKLCCCPLIVSGFFLVFLPVGWYELPWFSCEHQINFTSLSTYVMSTISSCFSFVFFIVFEPSVSLLLLLPCPYGISSYLFMSGTVLGCCCSLSFQGFLSSLLFLYCHPCFSLHFVAHAGVSRQTWRLAQLLENILCALF